MLRKITYSIPTQWHNLTFELCLYGSVLKIGWMRQGASGGSLTDAGGWSPAPPDPRTPLRDPVTMQQVEVYRLYPFDI